MCSALTMNSNKSEIKKDDLFHLFKETVDHIGLPEQFDYPFYYEPHQISKIASLQLQEHLNTQTDWEYDFGMNDNPASKTMGKMFGVLVVKNQANELGFLAAFSGKLAESNIHPYFVPPIFDRLSIDGFYKKEEASINKINSSVNTLENHHIEKSLKEDLNDIEEKAQLEISALKKINKAAKGSRNIRRKELENISDSDEKTVQLLLLKKESIEQSYAIRQLKKDWKEKIEVKKQALQAFQQKIVELKNERKRKSAELQEQLFAQYNFLNINKEKKSLWDIFKNTSLKKPPSGAGVCAAPKLLQYAFEHNYTPITMAEFWWGKTPNSLIRKHKKYYPACRGKCEPILNHMLVGMDVAKNPLIVKAGSAKAIEVVYDDDTFAIINKPIDLLSTPGKHIEASVYTRVKKLFPEASGSLVIHRLDMATSGLMIIAKNEIAYKKIQQQFIQRTIQKRYIAILDGTLTEQNGMISLPLTVDFFERPRQKVSYEEGKEAITYFKVLKQKDNKTLVHFFPKTGRTHQLRVHSAHNQGLNTPICGDILYGTKSDRLYLHAEYIKFTHPKTDRKFSFTIDSGFDI